MSDISPSPPLNRRKQPSHRRGGGGGDFHHRGRDHPQQRSNRQHHHQQSSQNSLSNSQTLRQQQNQASASSASSVCSFVVLGDIGATSGVNSTAAAGGSSSFHGGGISSQEEFSDTENAAAGGGANNLENRATGRHRARRNQRSIHPNSGDGLLSNEDEEETNDERDELISDFNEQLDLAENEDRTPSVISKRFGTSFNVDGLDFASGDRFQQDAASGLGGASASPLLHPLHNASAVARSHAVGVPHNPLHNWQATKHTLKERFSFMFCNEILADVHFIVGRGDQRQRIPAHRFVLSVGSAVFDAMFNGAMAQSQMEDIDLPDVEPAAFLALLKFLYSDDVQIGPESVMTTLYTAKKYAVPALENACVEFLKRALNADNAFMLLTQARLFDEPHLAALCLEVIDKHTNEALNAEGFTDIDLDTLGAVLERDSLRIREVALFQAVVRWSTDECHRRNMPLTPENQRSVLGRSLQLIRFPLMTVEEFAQTAAQSGILSDRETVNLFLYFTVNPKPTVGFLDVPRCCVTGKEQVVNRFQRIEGRWGYSGTPDRIKFNVDRRIYVVGFGLYGSIHGPVEYQVTIQIIHCGTGKVVGSNDTTFQCDGSANTFRVLFKEPVEISASVTYIASACLKGPDSHYGTKGLRRVVQQTPNSGCVTFQFTYAAGNNNGTSVEDGQIPEIIYYTKLCA